MAAHAAHKKKKSYRYRPKRVAIVAAIAALLLGLVIFLIYKLTTSVVAVTVPLEISEYMSSNDAYPDENAVLCDWVELHNTGDKPVSIAGFRLIEGNSATVLPDVTIEADGYLVIYCDGEGKRPLHAALKLKSAGGETVRLQTSRGGTIDKVTTMPLDSNRSAIRGENGFVLSDAATPGYPNTPEGLEAFRTTLTAETGALVLSEVMAANNVTYPDADGHYYDYIEVANLSERPIPLKGYGLSNNAEKPLKYQFPDLTLQPGEVAVVFAAGKEYTGVEPYHATFGISKAGDALYLAAPNAVVIDSVTVESISSDVALLRNGAGEMTVSYTPSPSQPNTEAGLEAYRAELETYRQNTGLVISEVMSHNASAFKLDDKYYDWIELHNTTNQPISLSGYHLSDKAEEPNLYALPDRTLAAGGYLLIYASGGEADNANVLQAPFKLNGDGAVMLYAPDGSMADAISFSDLPMNTSAGRMDGQKGFFFFASPTPNAANGLGKRVLSAAPTVKTPAGVYEDVESVTVELAGSGTIYYTIDGSDPTTNSKRYTGPFTLTKTTAVRTIAVEDHALPSSIVTASYIINEHHTVDVVSLVSDPDNLFSDATGIYATGPNASSEFPYLGANYWQDWERDAHVELFSGGETVFSTGCGVKIFGAYSRTYEKKSLKLNFRDCYGAAKLNANVFASRDYEEFNALILRTSGQDRLRTIMKDVLTTSLADDEGILDVQAYRPIIVYINGQYWGMHYIREKINEHYIASRYQVSPESVDLLQGNGIVNAGSNKDWKALMQYVSSHDLRQTDAYNYVKERVDLQNYADYIISEIYCGNTDTGNIRYFRSSEGDGKWRWILFDTDLGFQAGLRDSIWFVINPAGTGAGQSFSTALINGLLKNDEFRTLFIERWTYHMHNTFSTERVIARIDQLQNIWKTEATRNFQKWKPTVDWEGNVEGLRTFAKGRQAALKAEFTNNANVRAVFNLTAEQLNAMFE